MDGEMSQSEDELPGAKEQNLVEAVLAYHRRTKHHLHRYAASLGYQDWATQPDPFRTYAGAERIELPFLADRLDAAYAELYFPGVVPAMPLERNSVAMLFELALGLSALKQYKGSRWALRCNPSSGNLHPTEGYAILPEMPGLNAGVYHYVSRDHCLERRCVLEGRAAARTRRRLRLDRHIDAGEMRGQVPDVPVALLPSFRTGLVPALVRAVVIRRRRERSFRRDVAQPQR